MTIRLSAELEQRLREEASRRGVAAEVYAEQLIEAHLPAGAPGANRAALELLSAWDAEDETNDPAEIERRQAEWEAFRRSINEHSLSERMVYP